LARASLPPSRDQSSAAATQSDIESVLLPWVTGKEHVTAGFAKRHMESRRSRSGSLRLAFSSSSGDA
jgi:hypothetical protein